MLELVLKTKWFEMIESGEKKEEYRDVTEFWCTRLFKEPFTNNEDPKHNLVRFSLGYKRGRKQMIFRINNITQGIPNMKWCDVGGLYYRIHLGERIQ